MNLKELIRNYRGDILFRNSLYLIFATVVMAGFGFFFWLINAHLFSIKEIGYATALISVMNLIAIFSLAGFDATLVRFLPKADNKNVQMNTGLIVVGITAFVVAGLFVTLIGFFSKNLAFVQHPLFAAAFLFGCLMNALNILTDAIFLAERQTRYTLFITTAFSFVKMVLPFAFVDYGALGIFTAAALAQALGFALSIITIIRVFGYQLMLAVDPHILKKLWRYSTGNYLAGVLGLLPVTLLPLLITEKLGPEAAAYYYITMMIAGVLYMIPWATARSLFAESSHDEVMLGANVVKTTRIILVLLTPAIIVLVVGAHFIMEVFGKNYALGGTEFLRLIALTGFAVSAYSIFGSFFKVIKDLRSLIIMNIVYAGSILGLSVVLMRYGLNGIGVAWLLGNITAGAVGYFLYRRASHAHLENILQPRIATP